MYVALALLLALVDSPAIPQRSIGSSVQTEVSTPAISFLSISIRKTNASGWCLFRSQADSMSQDALVCIRVFIEQALISRCGYMQHRQRTRTPAENVSFSSVICLYEPSESLPSWLHFGSEGLVGRVNVVGGVGDGGRGIAVGVRLAST